MKDTCFLLFHYSHSMYNYIRHTVFFTSCLRDSRSARVLEKAITSAPHCTRAFTVARPIPVQNKSSHILHCTHIKYVLPMDSHIYSVTLYYLDLVAIGNTCTVARTGLIHKFYPHEKSYLHTLYSLLPFPAPVTRALFPLKTYPQLAIIRGSRNAHVNRTCANQKQL